MSPFPLSILCREQYQALGIQRQPRQIGPRPHSVLEGRGGADSRVKQTATVTWGDGAVPGTRGAQS